VLATYSLGGGGSWAPARAERGGRVVSKISDLLPEIGNTVAYCPQLALALGGCIEGIFMSQLLFWHDKVPDGRIGKTREQFFAETGLGRWEQKTARNHLVSLAVITEEHDWAQNKLYFTVNVDALKAVWKRYRETGVSPTFEAKPKKRPRGEVAMQPLLGPPRRSGQATSPRGC